jgi:hypothetical protein
MKDLTSLVLLTLLIAAPVVHAQKRVATGSVPPPAFKDLERLPAITIRLS